MTGMSLSCWKMAQRLQTVHARQAHVEQDQVGRVAADQGQRVFGRCGRAGAVAGLFQLQAEAAPQQRVIVNDKDMFGHKSLPT